MLIDLFEFMTFAFPKAGAQLGVPITIAMFFFLFALLKCQYQVIPVFSKIKGLSTAYIVFAGCVVISLIFNLGDLSSFQVTVAMVVLASPLAVGIGYSADLQRALKILAVSLIIAGGYALIQRVAGIVTTAIPGLTYTFGQDLAAKPIGYGMAAVGEAQKMPSTYQNGNGAGLFYAMGIPILLSWVPLSVNWKLVKYLALFFGFFGLFLSGSRSIMFPFVLLFIFLLILVKNKLSYQKQILFLSAVFFIAALGTLYLMYANNQFLEGAYARYIQQTASDPTGAGRTSQFALAFTQVNQLNELGFLRFLLIGLPWSQLDTLEGLLSTLFCYGLFGFIGFLLLFMSALYHSFKMNLLASLGLVCIFLAFMVDGSFNFPPSLMNFFFLTGLLAQPAYQQVVGKSEAISLSFGIRLNVRRTNG